jgi:hypothetical protein
VPGVRRELEAGAADGVGQPLAEAGVEPGVVPAPHHEGRDVDFAERRSISRV